MWNILSAFGSMELLQKYLIIATLPNANLNNAMYGDDFIFFFYVDRAFREGQQEKKHFLA